VGRTIGSQGRFVAFHCLRACTSQTACRSLFLRPLQKPPPAMTKTSLSNGQRRSWARNLPRKYAPSAWKSTAALPLMQNHAASSLPTRNLNLVCSTTNYSGSTKPSRPILPASGPPRTTAPAVPKLLLTNSLFATISSECSGRKPRPALNFLLKSSRPLVPSTGKPIASWPGANWISKPGPHTVSSRAERAIVKDQLEGLVNQMVERGILFDE